MMAPALQETQQRKGDQIQIAGDYQYAALTRGFSVQRHWHEIKLRLLEAVVPLGPDKVVLDCGCGSGVVASFVAERCARVYGADANAQAIAFASSQFRRPNLEFHCALVEEMDLPPDHFDLIICMEVIEHLYEPQVSSLLGTFHLLMKPGAHLFLTTPNYRGLWPLVERVADRSGKVAPMDSTQHVSKYHRAKLRREVQAAGFSIVQMGTFSTFAPFLAPIHPKLVDLMYRFERTVDLPFGNLLFVLAEKH
jgi:2-polyprenyl-3-methyl-5-hydroxy-6-metoxy-1,4-benzoquinol methylase